MDRRTVDIIAELREVAEGWHAAHSGVRAGATDAPAVDRAAMTAAEALGRYRDMLIMGTHPKPDTLLEVARRGNEVFGKRWQEITGFKSTPAKDAT